MHDQIISLKKVYVHNLKGVDLTLRPQQLIAFSGVSGSGKSSLAFDTIYREGQRRYLESLSTFAKRQIGGLEKPDAESIEGLSPCIAIEQKSVGKNPRSTVGTMTAIYDYLRILFARLGTCRCPVTLKEISIQTESEILEVIAKKFASKTIQIFAPLVQRKKGAFEELFFGLEKKGFLKVRINGSLFYLERRPFLNPKKEQTIQVFIDECETSDPTRTKESILQALEMGHGSLLILEEQEEHFFSTSGYTDSSGHFYSSLEPHHFSFNHIEGMCPDCQGLGSVFSLNFDLILKDPSKGLEKEAFDSKIVPKSLFSIFLKEPYVRKNHISGTTPISTYPKEIYTFFIKGILNEGSPLLWEGLEASLNRTQKMKDQDEEGPPLFRQQLCPSCKGCRLAPYPAAVLFHEKSIGNLVSLPIKDLLLFFQTVTLSQTEELIGRELIREIVRRLTFLDDVGLGYLSLERGSHSLSGGESQRVRLAGMVGQGLVGTTYILDEPSIGLHPRDNLKLLQTLRRLTDQGNTVIVVEHDEETLMEADTIVDVGPLGGRDGGKILSQGSLEDLFQVEESITGAYLQGKKEIAIPQKRSPSELWLHLRGITHHNLLKVDLSLPLGLFIAVTGVSGSGKSSLITDVLYPTITGLLEKKSFPKERLSSWEGVELLDKVISIDQAPIGRTPRSNPATYIKLFDEIRNLFASLPESQALGFKSGRFSFNVREGSCLTCKGMGLISIDLDFMEEEWTLCPHCKGERFDSRTLSIAYKGKTIYDVLEMSAEEARDLFSSIPTIRKKLDLLIEVGLGYLKIGQSSTTLSGGEAQRIKLAKELSRPSTGKTLYLLDEPTTGLHFEDVSRLIQILQRLVNKGNSVIVIEHHMDLVKCADWIVDLGPEAGANGGKIIACAPPEQLLDHDSPTGESLRKVFADKSLLRTQTRSPSYQKPIQSIDVIRAEQNHLKNLSLSIPRGAISIFTGPSGSGKSSLGIQTLYAEGQRRYIESLPAYARQFIPQLPKPKVEEIRGLSAAIALEQRRHAGNPRSTIGTITEIYDFLRIIYAALGIPHCPVSKEKIVSVTNEYIADHLLTIASGQVAQFLVPIKESSSFEELRWKWMKLGYSRIRLNGQFFELTDPIPFDITKKNELEVLIDRVSIEESRKKRILDALEQAFALCPDWVYCVLGQQELHLNRSFMAIGSGLSYPRITPSTLSFNHEEGMCHTCSGIGRIAKLDLLGHSPFHKKSIYEILSFFGIEDSSVLSLFRKIFPLINVPLSSLLPHQIEAFIRTGVDLGNGYFWIGLERFLERLHRFARQTISEPLAPLFQETVCPDCLGERINPLGRHVTIDSISLPKLLSYPLTYALDFIQKLSVPKELLQVRENILHRLTLLVNIGLEYLSLDRTSLTLSGGEIQRIHLARQLGTGLTGVLYVLDEPSIGLHPHDTKKLNSALKELKDLNNTLVLIEHDPMLLDIADCIYDFGPECGEKGGHLLAYGTLEQIKKNEKSITGNYLNGSYQKRTPPRRELPQKKEEWISVERATKQNLKQLSVSFPKNRLSVITGVSGSGKSTLLHEVLHQGALLSKKLKKDSLVQEEYSVSGLRSFQKVSVIDQTPLGLTERASIASYTGLLDGLRHWYASLERSKSLSLQPKHFSPNHLSGMCMECRGRGTVEVRLLLLPSVYKVCPSCEGLKLSMQARSIFYQGMNLGEVLKKSSEELYPVFSFLPEIERIFTLLKRLGLGSLPIGQQLQTLSQGEAQRLRMITELVAKPRGSCLYLLDEPTTGLHEKEIQQLLPIFDELIEQGHTLILIEHHLSLIHYADYLVELGPFAGENGGKLVASGSIEQILDHPLSLTAPYLK